MKRLGWWARHPNIHTYIQYFLELRCYITTLSQVLLYRMYDTFFKLPWHVGARICRYLRIKRLRWCVSTTSERTYVHTVLPWTSLLRYNSLPGATYIACMILFAQLGHIGARIYRYLWMKRLGWWARHPNIHTYIQYFLERRCVTVQLSPKCYLYSMHDTFCVVRTYRSENI